MAEGQETPQEEAGQAESFQSGPKKTAVEVPEGLETFGSKGGYATVYIDRGQGIVYRTIDWERLEQEEPIAGRSPTEYARNDFNYKVEVGEKDKTGLTPKIYEYDPESGTIKMELIKGVPFTKIKPGKVSQEAATRFLDRLAQYHRQGLYHGDMFDLNHWILTEEGEVRLIDPSFIYGISEEIPLERQQEIDMGLAKSRLREYGIKSKN